MSPATFWVFGLALVALLAAVAMLVLEVRRLRAEVELALWAAGATASHVQVPDDFFNLYSDVWCQAGYPDGLFIARPITNDEETPSDAS